MVEIINWLPLILLFTLFGAVGGLFFKKAGQNGLNWNKGLFIYLCLGGCFYGIGALLNIYVLQHVAYTILFPLTSITYVWTFLLAAIFLKEKITLQKVGGISLIIIGSLLLI
ncbi:EamA family transporter [Paraliobacillus sediminis]|uniref:EamA family transporter n=1 Tax=Paraliobacillus sediminis TaxID=1885916 RepID=UPI001F07BBC4|nr:EamA family transporter [Paraliobacillus sediminis]